METVIVWLGSGFAFAVGVCIGAWIMRMTWKKPTDDTATERAEKALTERNEIGRKQVAALERIAEAMESTVMD